ncbi:hypothetical protein [Actinokineospora iranica]|uniref:Uncharacterized protein n=1 Tax=Actinokineospora iranica TaxID=1271860 RepID=A0A1G6XZM2_9PSEU|nr:hypothetical protein [Actinokineospora iranica]SDD82825.1 hypothetical protein SAMN05216174_11950 [Actinokineospora iranica]
MYDSSGGIGAAVSAFAGAAASGMVSIDPDAAQAALTEIGSVRDELIVLANSMGWGNAEVELGANPVGEAMARKSVDRFQGSEDSLIAVLAKLMEQIETAENALKHAIANYQHTDQGNAAKYRG